MKQMIIDVPMSGWDATASRPTPTTASSGQRSVSKLRTIRGLRAISVAA